jgi:AcrR family transcriptional regulator
MPKSAQQTRERILQAAHRLFRRVGFFRAGIDEIARASGVTKRTVYHHFESKDALLAAVLTAQHEHAFAVVHPYGIKLEGQAHEIVDLMFAELMRWSATPHWAGSGFTRLAMELADLPGHPARTVAHRHKAWLESYLADAFGAAGVSVSRAFARELAMLIEGAMVMILIHGDKTYAEAAAIAAKRLLGSEPG